jgi:protein-disulfide isomerase
LPDGNPNLIFPLLMTAIVFFVLGAMVSYIVTDPNDEDNDPVTSVSANDGQNNDGSNAVAISDAVEATVVALAGDLSPGGDAAAINAAVQATFIALTPTATPPPTRVPVSETFYDHNPSLGPDDAPVTLVEFSDYLCPFCARFHTQTLDPLLEHYDGLVRFVYREYPIIGGQASGNLSIAAKCVGLQDKYWEFTDLIWENQASDERRQPDDELIIEFAETIGVDIDQMNACIADGTGLAMVQEDFDAGRTWGINATPGFFVNGNRFTQGAVPIESFVQLIDAALREQGIEPPPYDFGG